jgi:hypothetical protein
MKKYDRIANVALLAVSLFFFWEGVFSDWYYSNCVSVGSPSISCLNNAYGLKDIVLIGNKWILSPFQFNISQAHPYISFSNVMGISAGLGFIGICLSVFWLTWHTGRLRAFCSMILVSGSIYFLMMIGFLRFFPYCVVEQCRITNYLPFISYYMGFEIATLAWSLALLGYFYPRLRLLVK